MKNQKCIVRGTNSGVFFGEIKERNGQEVTMTNARRLWYWNGACSISEIAQSGVQDKVGSKFSVPVDEMIVLDACEINICTEEAVKSIDEVKEWKYQR